MGLSSAFFWFVSGFTRTILFVFQTPCSANDMKIKLSCLMKVICNLYYNYMKADGLQGTFLQSQAVISRRRGVVVVGFPLQSAF